jgi:hypothetical protein
VSNVGFMKRPEHVARSRQNILSANRVLIDDRSVFLFTHHNGMSHLRILKTALYLLSSGTLVCI